MRYSVLAGALIIGACIAMFRPALPVTSTKERRAEKPARAEAPVPVAILAPVPHPVQAEPPHRPDSYAVKPAAEKPATVSSQPLGGVELARQKMLFLFEREVRLSAEQRHFMVSVLADRDREVEGIQQQIRATGIFQPNSYDRRILEIQGASYQRMAQVLDANQQRRFSELVLEGRLGDAVSFELGPRMVIVQD